MKKKLTDIIIRTTNLKTLVISVAAVVAFETAFFILMPGFTEATGGPLLDMSVGYSAEFAYERLVTFEKAADIYFKIRLIDFFFPLVYGFAFSTLSCFVYRRKYENSDNYRWILRVPFLAAVFDYTENIMLVILYNSLPAQFLTAAKILNIVSILKFGLLGFSILLFVTGALSLLKGGDSALLIGNKFRGEDKDKKDNE